MIDLKLRGIINSIKTKGGSYMAFEEAVEQGYTVIVANTLIAEKLRKKYKKNIFKSIRSRTLDGLRNTFIDQTLQLDFQNKTKYLERNKGVYDVVYGNVPSVIE